MVQGQAAREEQLAALRRRLDELNTRLGIQLPVYLLITKCDLVAGFSEYFSELTAEGRAQVWGTTFPYERTRNSDAARDFPNEFDALVLRLNERVFGRVHDERDPRRRARAFAFPQEFASLRTPLSDLVTEVFGSTRFDRTILLRGVYFTSGTQEGNPIDRLLGALGRRFAVAPGAVATASRGKAYFIERLLKEVAIPESGLAGVNRRHEVKKAAAQLASYAAMIAIGVLGVLALSVSYARNRTHVREVEAAAAEIRNTPSVPESASAELMLPRLNAVEHVFDVARKHEADVPWSMGWGLYQGDTLADDARAAYVDVLNGPLLSHVAARFRERIEGYASEPIVLYEYLKGYLILLQPEAHTRIEAADLEHLRVLAKEEWGAPAAAEAVTGPLMLRHFGNLLAQGKGLRPIPRDANTDGLVERAQTSVRQASIAQLSYLRLRRASEQNTSGAFRLDEKAGLGAETLLRRKDGVSLSTPVAALYTKAGFEEVAAPGALGTLVAPLANEQWVWGQDMPRRSAAELESELFDSYQRDYIATWDAVLQTIEVRIPAEPGPAAEALGRLAAAANSPLRNLLRAIDEQTFLVKPAVSTPDKDQGLISSAAGGLGTLVKPLLGSKPTAVPRADVARERITAHFAELHTLVGGDPGTAPIDRALVPFGQLQEKLRMMGGDVGPNPKPTDPAAQAAVNMLIRDVRATASTLPAPFDSLVSGVAGRLESVVVREVRGGLAAQYATEVGTECKDLVEGRYPLTTSSMEATPMDFARVFGYGGAFDRFQTSTLEPLIDTTRRPWTWRPTVGGAAAGPAWMLKQFEAARYIRDNYFRPGSQTLELSFRITPVELDARVGPLVVEVDGQRLSYQHGPEQTMRMTWPKDAAGASITFFDKSAVPPSIPFSGNWGFFKLLDAAQIQSESETRHVLTFTKNGYTARLRIEADSNRNPFHRRDVIRTFSCGG
jgi:type VI secretion system protein ImpL